MNSIEEIRAKIAKLMALGNDEGANQFEAEAALRQAEKLMRKHAIDAADIQARTGTKPVYDWQKVLVPASIPGATTCIGWFGSLAIAVAVFTDCAAGWRRYPQFGMCIELRGDAMDVGYACYLLKHLRDAVRRDSAAFVGNRREREDFRLAMIERIKERTASLKAEQRAAFQEAAQHGTGSALVVVDNKIALRDEAMGKPKYGQRKVRVGDLYARSAGAAAGDRVGFGRPVGHTPTAAIDHA